MHKSVYSRYAAGGVVLFDTIGDYRPVNVNEHIDFLQYYDSSNSNPKPTDPAQCVADDIEAKWANAKAANAGT
jgi:hypothetical protein